MNPALFLPGLLTRLTVVWLIGLCLFYSQTSFAVDIESKMAPQPPVDGWEVDGMHGEFMVTGSLTESPCVLAMESEEQSVELGTVASSKLVKLGDRSQPVPIHLRFHDCGMVGNNLHDDLRGGIVAYLPDQLVSFITLTGEEEPSNLHLLRTMGEAKGVAIRLEDAFHHQLVLGEHSGGLIMEQGDTDVVLYAMLERTATAFQEGHFKAMMNFTVGYH